MSMIRIRKLYMHNPHWQARIVNFVHDEVNLVGNAEYIEDIARESDRIVYEEFHYYIRDTKVTWDDWKEAIGDKWSEK